jgi:hypothetical protein
MAPLDEDFEAVREDAALDADGDALRAEQQANIVVGPLTDDELEAGGMERTVAFIRTAKSKAALRQAKRRAKQKASNLCQMNIEVPDNNRARATMYAAASELKDDVAHQAFEVVLANRAIRPVLIDLAARPELSELVDHCHRHPAATDLLELLKLIDARPELATVLGYMATSPRIIEAVKIATTHPEFVFFGRNAATQNTLCAWLARKLLRIKLPARRR